MVVKRDHTHAGSWYSSNGSTLSAQLGEWLEQVPDDVPDVGELPKEGARTIIAPHAGYAYSGPTAAWAYKSLDLSQVKRIFLLGPSHHVYITNATISQCTHYKTPMGDLRLDTSTITELHRTGKFGKMTKSVDEEEHSLEMHLPYIYKVLSEAFRKPAEFPLLIPIMVGNTSPAKEQEYGAIFAPYMEDETSVFIASSDFCHWGLRFNYTYYLPSSETDTENGIQLSARDKPEGPPIYAAIDRVDRRGMEIIESGDYAAYIDYLETTGNTICGRHPIGIVMCALESLKAAQKLSSRSTSYNFLRYERSSQCKKITDSSVSYASAFAVVDCGVDRTTANTSSALTSQDTSSSD